MDVYGGRTTMYCTDCARTHDLEWTAAKDDASRCACPGCPRFRMKNCYGGARTRYCAACSKVHDPEWYARYWAAHLCVAHPETMCDTQGLKHLEGHCARCYMHLFPDSTKTVWMRSKELHVIDRVKEWFPDLPWISNARIDGAVSRRRPDVWLELGHQVVVIEVDEHQHATYDCENRRMMELSRDVQHRPIVIIRFNPDAYRDGSGARRPSCWGRTPKTQEPRVAPKQRRKWDERLARLRRAIADTLETPSQKTLTEVQLYYDGFDE